MNNFIARLQRDWRWQAFLRGVSRGIGLPVEPIEPIDYSPEAQMVRLAERLRRLAEAAPELPDPLTMEDAGPAAESDAMRDDMRNRACDILFDAIGECPSKPDAAAGEDPGACMEVADAFADIAERFLERGGSTERR